MKQELIAPTAALAAAILQKGNTDVSNPDVIGSAFESAYRGLLVGIQRVDSEASRQPMTTAKVTGS